MKRFRIDGCTALVTGASAGLGWEFARQLAGRAGSLVLVARRADRLAELRDELTRADPNLNVIVRPADLSRVGDVNALCDSLQAEGIAVDLLINNAGLGDYGDFAASKPERVREIIAVNVTALTLLTRRLVPAMISRGQGAVVNVSSSAGFLPIAGMTVYAATKAYVTSFSEALRMELRGSGVRVTAVCPGPVHTEFNSVAQRSGMRDRTAPELTHVSPSAVVRASLRAVERDQPVIIPGALMKLGMLLVRLTPMPLLRIAGAVSQRH